VVVVKQQDGEKMLVVFNVNAETLTTPKAFFSLPFNIPDLL
jgi:hypothetical protein